MRRFISYIALTASLLLGAGLASVPTIMNMDGDLGYADGQTLYFRAAPYDEGSENGNYATDEAGSYSFIDNTHYIASASEKAPIEYIADTMRSRLDDWGVSGYRVETQGDSTVAVSLRTANNSSTQLEYLQRLLTFNGGDFSFDATDTSYEDYAYDERWSTMVDGQTARIEDIDMEGYKVPVVVIPLKDDTYKASLTNLIAYCNSHTVIPEEKEGQESTEEPTYTNIVVWANRSTLAPETYDEALKNKNQASKIIMVQSPQNGNATWYASTDTEHENPSLQLIPGSKATSSGTYDPTYTQEAYDAARFLMTLLNCDAFEYDAFKGSASGNKFALTYLYSERADASVENLIVKEWNKEPAMSKTLIAILVTMACLCLILALFERAMALIEIAAMTVTGFASFACFVAFGAQFNIAALLGLLAASLIGLFGALFYSSRLKDEIYKGRTVKKAHAEASKRSTWPIIDAGIITIIIGVFTYVFGGDIASKAGVMIVLGGLFGTLFNLIITRIACYMLTHDSTVAVDFPKFLHVDKTKIPDLLKEEKQSYFGPYANKEFHKGAKIGAIVSGVFLLAAMGAMIGWGVASDGSFFNSSAYEQANTVLLIDVKSEKSDVITVEKLSQVSSIYDAINDDNHDAVLNNYQIDGISLSSMVSDVNLSSSPHEVVTGTDADDLTHEYWYYYVVTLNRQLDTSIDGSYDLKRWDGSAFVSAGSTNLVDFAETIKADTVGESATNMIISFASVNPEGLTPYFYQVAMGLGIGLGVAMVYMVIRYRPSRGLSIAFLTASTSFSAVGFYALTRISTTPVVSLGAVLVMIAMLLAALFILASEQEIHHDCREKEKNTLEMRSSFLAQATSRQADNAILFILLAVYICIMGFAFGPSEYAAPYVSAILGLALAALALLTLLQPSSVTLAKAFSHIRIRPIQRKSKKNPTKGAPGGGHLLKRKKGAEPEEAIFIGIND